MKAEKYIRISTDLPEDANVKEIMIRGDIVIELMNGFKQDKIIELPVELESEDYEGEEDHITDRCPMCGSTNVDKLDDGHDVCINCRAIWEV